MAEGDITIFDEGWTESLENWVGTDTIKCAVLLAASTPLVGDASPALGSYTEHPVAGTYVAGGQSIGTWANFVDFASNVTTLDSTTNPSWLLNASHSTTARWFLLYNDTQAGDPAFAFVDLGGNKDMTLGDLGATWHGSGIATITN